MSIKEHEIVKQAIQIFEAQAAAHNNKGDTTKIEQFLALTHPEMKWRFPMGKYAGDHEGNQSFGEFFRYACAFFNNAVTYYLDQVFFDGEDTVAFRFHDEAVKADGSEYKANVCIMYTIKDGKLYGYREYFG
jgi:ketosteroid isomerase-like protein